MLGVEVVAKLVRKGEPCVAAVPGDPSVVGGAAVAAPLTQATNIREPDHAAARETVVEKMPRPRRTSKITRNDDSAKERNAWSRRSRRERRGMRGGTHHNPC